MAQKNQLFVILFIYIFISCNTDSKKDLVKYANPMIGASYSATPDETDITIHDFGQVLPAVSLPFGMTQWTPQVLPTEQETVSPYYTNYLYIHGFRATNWPEGLLAKDYGSFTFMPINEVLRTAPEMRKSSYNTDIIECDPSYLSTYLESYGIMAEITSTKRAGFFRFSWLTPDNPKILIDVNSDKGKGFIKIDTLRNEVYGYNPVYRFYSGEGEPAGFKGYFVARFNEPINGFGTYSGMDYTENQLEDKNKVNLGAYVGFNLEENSSVLVKVGTSFTSIENARENLDAEIPHWDFPQTRKESYNIWNDLLNTIQVTGGLEDDYTKFYSAIYRACLQPRLFSDVNGSYPVFNDSIIKKTDGFDYYSDFSAWNTSKSQMPLVSLIAPKQYEDMVKSLIMKAEDGGWMPTSPMWNNYTSDFIGDNVSTIIADAYLKGFDVDIKKVWPVMINNAYETPENLFDYANGKGRRGLESYLLYGYIPLEDKVKDSHIKNAQVTRTLEYAYNDWVLAQVAKDMGETEIQKDLSIRAENYTNVFNQEKGWVCGKYTDGLFTNDLWENDTISYLAWGSPKQNTWYVPHDVQGLIDLMGGTNLFESKLNDLFKQNYYQHELVIMQHIPYFYNYIGKWDQTQKVIKNILKTKYGTTAMGGLAGNENAGQLSSWYVFSAMGFYPVCAGSKEFQLSSPIFEEINITLDKKYYEGSNFKIKGNSSGYDIYSNVTLNGKSIGTTLLFDDLKKGGKLEFKN